MHSRPHMRFSIALALTGLALSLFPLTGCVDPAPSDTQAAFLLSLVWEDPLRTRDERSSDDLGYSVAVSGSTAVVGAPFQKVGANDKQGAAYVFTRNTEGQWTHRQTLTASSGAADDNFGSSVAIDGTQLIVGAPRTRVTGYTNAGAAYVFELVGGCWTERQRLVANDPGWGRKFGSAVAIGDHVALVGAPNHTNDRGSAYFFRKLQGTWSLSTVAVGQAAGERFGHAVALFGPADGLHRAVALVGAPKAGAGAGAVDRFESLTGSTFLFFERHAAPSGAQSYGHALDLDDIPNTCTVTPPAGSTCAAAGGRRWRRALIGAPDSAWVEDRKLPEPVNVAGLAFVVEETSNDVWQEIQELHAEVPRFNGRYGLSVALDLQRLAVGAPQDPGVPQGLVEPWVFHTSQWNREAAPAPISPSPQDLLGSSLAMDGNVILAGAMWDDDPYAAGTDQGSVVVFGLAGGLWVERDLLFADEEVDTDRSGAAVANHGDTTVVGAPLSDRCTSPIADEGAVYVYRRTVLGLELEAKLTAPDAAPGDYFGSTVAVYGNVALVGAPGKDIAGMLNRGAVYHFERSGGVWNFVGQLTAADGASVDEFGHALALGEAAGALYAVIGAWLDDGAAGVDQGSVYSFIKPATSSTFTQNQKLVATDARPGDNYGAAVALGGGRLIVGAPWQDPGGQTDRGAAYVYSGTGTFNAERKLVAITETGAQFGAAVALNSDTAFVGEPYRDGGVVDRGAVHRFVWLTGNAWSNGGLLTAGAAGDRFGSALALAEDALVVGAPYANRPTDDEGAAYLYVRGANGWLFDQAVVPPASPMFHPPTLTPDANFGNAAAIDADRLLVSAPRTRDRGAVFSATY